MSGNAELQARREAAVPRGIASMHARFAAKALNAELWDVEGKRYIDFASGIAVLNTGHNHPKVVAAVKEQLDAFAHTSFQVNPYEPYIRLAERLNKLAPGKSPKKTIFFTTGAEAVENAIKIARHKTGRSAVIALKGAFHGRTLLTMALTGKVVPYKAGFGPLAGDVYHAPMPIAYHGIGVEDALAALDGVFKADVEPERVAAIIVEPVQGEGGFYPVPVEFLQALRQICDKHGILLIADEIQTGFARTGKVFATEYAGIEPDMMTVAKSMGGGFPISGVIGKAEIMDSPNPGGLGGTYGGPPLACAAGNAVLDIIEEENLCERAIKIGELITGRLRKLKQSNRLACIGDIRNLGAMAAVELVKDGDADKPDADLTKAVVMKAAEKGLILLSCGVRGNVIRFLVPLTASDELVGEGMDILADCLLELAA